VIRVRTFGRRSIMVRISVIARHQPRSASRFTFINLAEARVHRFTSVYRGASLPECPTMSAFGIIHHYTSSLLARLPGPRFR